MAQDSRAWGHSLYHGKELGGCLGGCPGPGTLCIHPSTARGMRPEGTSLLDAQQPHLPCVCRATGWTPAPVCEHLWHHWLQEVWREAGLGIGLMGRVKENQSEIEKAEGFICFHEKTTSCKKERAGRTQISA